MHKLKPSAWPAMALLPALLLGACHKSDSSNAGAPVAEAAPDQDGLKRRTDDSSRQYAPLDLTPTSWPEAEYAQVYERVRNIYWSGVNKNLEKLAEDFSTEYRREKDSFKRADLLKTLAPQLEQQYAAAQAQKDYTIRSQQWVTIWPYDPAKGGFNVRFTDNTEEKGEGLFKDDDQHLVKTRWYIRYLGVPGDTLFYKPRDEQEARAIEAALTAQRHDEHSSVMAKAQYAGHVLGATTADSGYIDVALFGVDNITAIDTKTGKPLLTVPSSALGPIKIGCRSTREALKLPEPKPVSAVVPMSGSGPRRC